MLAGALAHRHIALGRTRGNNILLIIEINLFSNRSIVVLLHFLIPFLFLFTNRKDV